MNGIYLLVLFILVFILIVLGIVALYFNYNNKEISLRNASKAQIGKIESIHDKMWKVIHEKAQVSNEYAKEFERIYPDLIAGRYSKDSGGMMKWIHEDNPKFDIALYNNLMMTIEYLRAEFQNNQAMVLDIIREHTTLCQSYPAKWFISNKMPILYTIISSEKTKHCMITGIDNDYMLDFSKSN